MEGGVCGGSRGREGEGEGGVIVSLSVRPLSHHPSSPSHGWSLPAQPRPSPVPVPPALTVIDSSACHALPAFFAFTSMHAKNLSPASCPKNKIKCNAFFFMLFVGGGERWGRGRVQIRMRVSEMQIWIWGKEGLLLLLLPPAVPCPVPCPPVALTLPSSCSSCPLSLPVPVLSQSQTHIPVPER